MKNKKLKFFFAIILLFGMHSLKAQSVLQKQQKDIEQRKRSANETMLKARELQAQQQAERTSEVTIQSTPATKAQPNTQAVSATQQKMENKAPVPKKATTRQRSAVNKANTEQ